MSNDWLFFLDEFVEESILTSNNRDQKQKANLKINELEAAVLKSASLTQDRPRSGTHRLGRQWVRCRYCD